MRVIDGVVCGIVLGLFGCSAGAPEPSAESGASVASQDEALTLRRLCDGPLKLSCPKTEYCSAVAPGRCPSATAFGVCASEPRVCPDVIAPVCGCDGKTYGNSCFAAAVGVAVEHSGACAAAPPACGGIAGIPCPGFGRCADDPSDTCDPAAGGADCPGICSCIDTVLCIRGTHFNGDPKVCTCVPDAATQ